jgi:tetratricopeptide (TPR) repeat protein
MVPTGSSWLGWAYVIGGRVDEGMRLLADSLEQAKSMGMVVNYSNCYSLLTQAHLSAGRFDDAAQYARDLLEQAEGRNERGWLAYALHLSAESAAHKPSPDLALRYYTDALVAAKELGMRPLIAHCHLGLGKLSRRTGKREQAQEHLRAATTMYREMDMRFWLEQAEAELMEPGA